MIKNSASEPSTSTDPLRKDHFATTRWTMILNASLTDTPRAQAALAALCEVYWFPLYAYVRRRGYTSHDAEDLTQGFFARLLQLDSLNELAPSRGKFRAFLLSSIKNYLHNEWDRASAQKRDVRQTISIDLAEAEARYEHETIRRIEPELIFDRQWGLTLLERVIKELRQEYEGTGRGDLFNELRHTITLGDHQEKEVESACRLNMSPQAFRVAVHRIRKRYRQMLRDEIAKTVENEAEVAVEMDYLRRVITAS